LLLKLYLAVDGRSFRRSQVEGEVVSVALVHNFHTQVGAVDHVSPGVDDTTLTVDNGLVEVEAVEVERHGANAQSREPNADHGPSAQEEVQRTAVVERSVLEDQATEVAVSCHDVIGFFFLTEFVAVVLRLAFGGFTHQRAGNERTVHSGEERSTEHTRNTQHMEGVHEDVVLSLEHQHEVEGSADAQRHTIGERTLTDGVDHENCGRSSHRSAVSNADPRTHSQTEGQFPLTTHVGQDADEEVENDELVRAAVVQPLIQAGSFPDGIEVKSDCVGRRNNSTRDDVVAVEQRASYGFADTIDVHGRSSDESDDVAGGCGQQGGDHENTEPADVKAVVDARYPLAEPFPQRRGFALL